MPAPHSRDRVHRVSRRTWLKPWRTRNGWLPMQPIVSNMALRWPVNKEAQLATMLTIAFAVALFGWALVYLASAPTHPHESARHREPIPKVVRRHAASIAESPRMTQPWPLVRLRLDSRAEKRVSARRWPVTSASSASAGAIQ